MTKRGERPLGHVLQESPMFRLTLFLLGITIYILLGALAYAHSWYPAECCGDGDCHPVPCNEITQDDFGYYWHGIHFTWAMDKGPSIDGACHVCVTTWPQPGGPYPHCIFLGGIS
jgi:hypothetical protein